MTAPTRLQVIVAHPDDETFGCGSLLLHAAAVGLTTAVCCATRGEEGGADAARGTELGRVREAELRKAASALGVARVDVLDFRDSGMNGSPPAGSLMAADEEAVIAAVRTQIAAFRPDIVVTLDASDSHRDHVRIRDIALSAARAEAVASVLLSCLPRSLMWRWLEHMRGARPDMEHLDADVAAMGTPDDLITHHIDARDVLEARERAIAIHTSQVSPFEGLPADLRHAFLAGVHLQQIVPPWSGGAIRTSLARPEPV